MTLFRGKYRVETTRLPGWDYASAGYYFVTICTKDRFAFFGDIEAEAVRLSRIGQIADQYWRDIPAHFGHVELDAFVVMPNHVHGIVVITQSSDPNQTDADGRQMSQGSGQELPNRFGPLQRGSLQAIINAYKGAVTRACRNTEHSDFAWQARFYDEILRDEKGLHRVRQYIQDNPARWAEDRHQPPSVWM